MGWFLCYQQLLLPVQANFSLPFFLANKPGVLVFLLGCFCTKETATGEAQGIPRCLHPAECPRPAPGAAPVLQGEGCCQPHRPRAEPGSLPGREIPGQPGRALGQIPGAFVEAEPPCATHAAEASERLRDPGRKGCQESFPEQGFPSLAVGSDGQTRWRPAVPVGSPGAQRWRCCSGLAAERGSPPEGPLAQSWERRAPAIPPGSGHPAVPSSPLRVPRGSSVLSCLSLGQRLGSAPPEESPRFSGEGGRLMQAASHLSQHGGKRAVPPCLSPLSTRPSQLP